MSDVSNKKLVIDLDDTISRTKNSDYDNSTPIISVVEKIREYKLRGYDIVIYSSRNMRTYNRNVGEINVHTLPKMIKFLDKYSIPYDEIIVGKPWCGKGGFYVDDKAIRPSELVSMTEDEIKKLLKKEQELK